MPRRTREYHHYIGYVGRIAPQTIAEVPGRNGSQTPTKRPVTAFRLAINRPGQEPIWLQVEAWGSNSDRASNLIKKGSRVFVEGFNLEPVAYFDKTRNLQKELKMTLRDFEVLDKRSDAADRDDTLDPDPDDPF